MRGRRRGGQEICKTERNVQEGKSESEGGRLGRGRGVQSAQGKHKKGGK